MTKWQCSKCDSIFSSDVVPEECPSCQKKCSFHDVTCYIPDCGGPDNVDERLLGEKDRFSE
ncbi:hypothetical protein ACFLQQ_00065 [Actinomycetota bacterium]